CPSPRSGMGRGGPRRTSPHAVMSHVRAREQEYGRALEEHLRARALLCTLHPGPESLLAQSRNDRRTLCGSSGAYTFQCVPPWLGEKILRATFIVESEMERRPRCTVGWHHLVRCRAENAATALPATAHSWWQLPIRSASASEHVRTQAGEESDGYRRDSCGWTQARQDGVEGGEREESRLRDSHVHHP